MRAPFYHLTQLVRQGTFSDACSSDSYGATAYDPSAMGRSHRMFRLRMRPGRSMLGASSAPALEAATSAAAGEDVVVSEEAAAFLVRQRAAVIVEIIEKPPEGGTELSPER